MYAYFDGILADTEPDVLIVDVNGMGVNIHVHDSLSMALPLIGERIKLYTYTSVAEDKFMLYGFLSKEELDLFKILISVNGVGPKSAQAMISVLGADNIRVAIATEDVKTISKTPGIGAKTAGRMVNDLKDKMKMDYATLEGSSSKASALRGGAQIKALSKAEEECVTALVNLGYSRANAVKAVEMVENRESLSTEEILKPALKNIMFL